MERNNDQKSGIQVQQTVKMDRSDKESEMKCVCNLDICGLVEYKKNDESRYNEVCAIPVVPTVAACTMISITMFCCGCPK